MWKAVSLYLMSMLILLFVIPNRCSRQAELTDRAKLISRPDLSRWLWSSTPAQTLGIPMRLGSRTLAMSAGPAGPCLTP